MTKKFNVGIAHTVAPLSKGIPSLTCSLGEMCGLARENVCIVPGEGDEHTRLMIVGRDPGVKENELGRPFIGAGGKYLRKLIVKHLIKESNVYITNLVKCHTFENIGPTANQIRICAQLHLRNEIMRIKPLVIIALGQAATNYLVPDNRFFSLAKIRGEPRICGVIGCHAIVVPTYHPSPRNIDYYPFIERDFITAIKEVARLR